MREYGKVSPKFWIGSTGKKLRKQGLETQIVALYLMTCVNSNMIGMYYVPIVTIAHETGLTFEGAMKGLQGAIEADFCAYDDEAEVVWVYEMAIYQIAERLEERDLRSKGVQNEYDSIPESAFLLAFFEKYHVAFNMKSCRGIQAPSKPLLSQEHKQEHKQEQEQEQEHEQEHSSAAAEPAATKKQKVAGTGETWKAYSDAYFNRYGTEPVRNQTVNSQVVQFVKRLGETESPQVAAFFLTHNDVFYVKQMHAVGLLLKDAEKLRTEWATQSQMTHTKAMQVDKTQTNLDSFAPLIAEARAKEAEACHQAN
jgi:hypothetical protein